MRPPRAGDESVLLLLERLSTARCGHRSCRFDPEASGSHALILSPLSDCSIDRPSISIPVADVDRSPIDKERVLPQAKTTIGALVVV